MSLTGIGEIANLASNIANKFFPDKSQEEKDALALQIQQMTLASQERQGQAEVNKAEASNTSIFVAGWRPFVGWVCGSAFAWTFILAPMVSYATAIAGHPVALPALDLSQLSPVLMGMLGLSISRTVEKVNGIKAGH
ncbi:MAG TPA: holin family protein [Rhodocyclaceae bacterium]|nr:holin family protein [Rhodocyclaceae bacterium]